MQLKTGGLDQWSNTSFSALAQDFGKEAVEEARKYLKENTLIGSALRWHGRGLTLKDSIRKVLVDQEVKRNANGYSH